MTILMTEAVDCPKCGAVFDACMIGSFGHTARTSDFMPIFTGVNPLPHFVLVCPACNWADYASTFDPSDAKAEYHQPKLPAWKKFTLVAKQLKETGQGSPTMLSRIAWAYMQGAWAARTIDRLPEKERICLGHALEYFEQAITQDSSDRGESTYMCGEINRLLGNPTEALHYFQQVKSYANSEDKRKGLLNLCKTQIQATKAGQREVMVRSTD